MNNNTSEIHIRNNAQTKITSINLYNSIGQSVGAWKANLEGDYVTLPVQNKALGIYIVKINTVNGVLSKKVIIE
jgi:hypothetical protein